MIKVVCIKEPEFNFGHVMLGKTYDAEIDGDGYKIDVLISSVDPAASGYFSGKPVNPPIIKQSICKITYLKCWFMTLADWREQQINNILND